ncbi:MAG: hypothetical protein A2516_03955 [Alphaproteobacteria bacterium RIFOXYD12_FULL_60_8]|nr:MAG: hypothetical protein A2516_03955 [Alphaproteobacteria bacterium RIFOXYD12_FULL_60_8]
MGGARDFSDQIALIAEMSLGFASSEDITETLGMGLTRIAEYMDAEAASLFLQNAEGDLVCRACCGPVEITGLSIPAGVGIVGRTVETGTASMVRDVLADPDFDHAVDEQTGFTTRSILCAPMQVKDTCLGAIELINKRTGDGLFDAADRSSLEVLASSAALAILNSQLSEELIKQERVRRELEMAAEIQRNMLPKAQSDDYPIHGVNVPVFSVSGDFYDIMEISDGRIWFSIGDVSGKGMNAALMMVKTLSLFRCLGKTIHDPGRLMAAINSELCETVSHGMFVTMVAGLLDPKSGEISMANAGHEPPLLLKSDGQTFEEFAAPMPPLGIIDDLGDGGAFPEDHFDLDGGALYIFTDGLTEASVPGGGMLGGQGVRTLIRGHRNLTGSARMNSIIETVRDMGGPQKDDLTVLVVADCSPWCHVGQGGDDSRLLLSLNVPAQSDQLKPIRVAVTRETRGCGCAELWVQDLVLAIDEACQNIIRHAYKGQPEGTIELELWHHGDRIEVHLIDRADRIDPSLIKPRDLSDVRPGGLGTHFINEVMDEVVYDVPADGVGNLLRMTKRIE